MWGTIIGGIFGMIQNQSEAQAELSAQKNTYSAIIDNYAATKDSVRFMEWVNKSQAYNAQMETLRAGEEAMREAELQFRQAEGQVLADSGITAGASKARQLSSMYIMEDKVRGQVENSVLQEVIAIQDNLEASTTQLEAQLMDAYNNAALSIATNTIIVDPSSGIKSALAGAQTGQAVGSMLGDLFATNT